MGAPLHIPPERLVVSGRCPVHPWRFATRAGPIRFKGGMILFVGGKVAMDAACCCGTPIPPCFHCTTIPRTITATIAGVVFGGCVATTADYQHTGGNPNGTYTLLRNTGFPASTCSWTTQIPLGYNIRAGGGGTCTGSINAVNTVASVTVTRSFANHWSANIQILADGTLLFSHSNSIYADCMAARVFPNNFTGFTGTSIGHSGTFSITPNP